MDLSKILQVPTQLKIVSFFHRYPSTVDTARAIATWIEEDVKDVERVLEELVSLNILIAHRTSYTTAYTYTQNKDIISKIEACLRKNEKD
jgi:hypothetical protein